MNGSPIPRKQIERLIAKSAKQVIAQSEIHVSTRSGSKELEHLIRRLAEQPFANPTAAIQFGEELGRRIVALSQKMGRSNLDQGVIRQLMLLKQVPDPEAFSGTDQASAATAKATVEKTVATSAQISVPAEPVAASSTAVVTEEAPSELDEEELDEEELDEEELDEEELDEEELDEEELDEEELDEDRTADSLNNGPDFSADLDDDTLSDAEALPVDDKIAASTTVSESTEVEDDQETDAESVAAIVDSDDTDHDETEETNPASASANLSETSAESEDADSEDDPSEAATHTAEAETTTQSVDSETIAEPVA